MNSLGFGAEVYLSCVNCKIRAYFNFLYRKISPNVKSLVAGKSYFFLIVTVFALRSEVVMLDQFTFHISVASD